MRGELLSAVRSEGSLLPADLLARVLAEDKEVPGLAPEDYHLGKHEKINEAVSRSWNRLLGAWSSFREHLENFGEDLAGTTETRERWLYLVFQELGYGRLHKASGLRVEDKDYPISHLWESVPVHLLGVGVPLDRRSKGVVGAATTSPHSLVQEFLNRREDNLWGLVSNGRILRLLRDNVSLTRQAYVEFDLESIFQGEAYTDFKLFWLVCHQSRLEHEGRPHQCWLEKWSKEAQKLGTRALESLRQGVKRAIESLGRGFLAHPANVDLKKDLRSGDLDRQDYYRQLLRLVYRLLFLFVAEDRGLLLDPSAPLVQRQRYLKYYSTAHLRDLAERRKGGRHCDLYQGLRVVMDCLGRDQGCPELGLYPLGSFLWSAQALGHLAGCQIANSYLLGALRNLAFVQEKSLRRRVDYKNLGPEELGSVYESLLEQHPKLHLEAAAFELDTAAGNERKSTGSYYTPPELVQCLLDTALDPVIKERLEEARKQARTSGAGMAEAQEQALLNLSVCDPACGSGHFLIAATHRLAHRLASVRSGDSEPAPEEMRRALRDVIRHCIYGVDLNPMAVELCKVSLWMESLEPTKPFPFLDSKILCGNSLLGTTPHLLSKGIPDEAFKALEGDDKKWVAQLKKRNLGERIGKSQGNLFDELPTAPEFAPATRELETLDDSSLPALREIAARYQRFRQSPALLQEQLAGDAWCAAFVVEKRPELPAITQDVMVALRSGAPVLAATRALVERTAQDYHFLHWHLAFPGIFNGRSMDPPGWKGGFDVVLGNPPWEQVEMQEAQWFATRSEEIANAPNASVRKRLIEELRVADPKLHCEFSLAFRLAAAENAFFHDSDRYPLCGRGRTNTYAVFAETIKMLIAAAGRAGFIVPTGIVSDDTTKLFFSTNAQEGQIANVFSFENEDKVFPTVHHAFKFCLLTLKGSGNPSDRADLVFYLRHVSDLQDASRRFTLAPGEFRLLNPNTLTCPIFRGKRDAELNLQIYRRVPVLWKEGPPEQNPWGLSFRQGIFNMASDSGLFRTASQLRADGWELVGTEYRRGKECYKPLYEAKMLHHYDSRFSTYEGQTEAQAKMNKLPELTPEQQADPHFVVMPRYWVPGAEIESRLQGKWDRGWLMGWRDITNTTNERTVIASIAPRVGMGHTSPLLFSSAEPELITCLYAILCSYVFDYAARQKVGGTHLTYSYLKQLPVLPPSSFAGQCPWDPGQALADWISSRVLKLTYSAHDLKEFASDLGYHGQPFSLGPDERLRLRVELEAAFFMLYGLTAEEAAYVFTTFPTCRRYEIESFGEFRTERLTLECYSKLHQSLAVSR